MTRGFFAVSVRPRRNQALRDFFRVFELRVVPGICQLSKTATGHPGL